MNTNIPGKYLAICRDARNSAGPRRRALDDHLRYLESNRDRVFFAAALRKDDESPSGSVFVVAARDRTSAENLIKGDPFFLSGVWNKVRVDPVGAAVGSWIDGRE